MINSNKGKVKPTPPKKPPAKVSSLRSRFESFTTDDRKTIHPKVQPKQTTVLIRNESARNNSTLEYRKALIVDVVPPIMRWNVRPGTSTSVSDESRCSDDVDDNIYENLRVENIRVKPEPMMSDAGIDTINSTVGSSQSSPMSSRKLSSRLNQSALHRISMSTKIYSSPLTLPKPPRPTPPPRPAVKASSELLDDLMKDIEILNMKRFIISQQTIADDDNDVTIQRVSSGQRVSDDDFVVGPIVIDTLEDSNVKIKRVIQELLENEQVYISTLKQGIDSYIAKYDSVELPATLVGQKRNIFSNIEAIHEYHSETFYPRLVACDYDAEKIAEAFTTSIDRYQFEIYILYVVNSQTSERLCKENEYFFRQIQEDRLGVRNFLLQPVQRLPRYQLLIAEILKCLFKNLVDENKKAVKAYCIAEKTIQRLLKTVNEYCNKQVINAST